MFILRNESTNSVLLNKKQTMMILCRDRRAAESAVKAIRSRFGISMTYDRVDRAKTAGLWSLRRRNGKPFELERGVEIAFTDKPAAWKCAGSIFNDTSKILIPTQA